MDANSHSVSDDRTIKRGTLSGWWIYDGDESYFEDEGERKQERGGSGGLRSTPIERKCDH